MATCPYGVAIRGRVPRVALCFCDMAKYHKALVVLGGFLTVGWVKVAKVLAGLHEATNRCLPRRRL